MRIRKGYMLREVLDMYVIVGTGNTAYTPNQIMSLSETGAFLWRILEGGAGREELIGELTAAYEVDRQTAEEDVDIFLDQLRANALLDE